MLKNNDFALEQLEERLEMLCLYFPYVGTCRKRVLWWNVYYPCIRYRRFCF